MRRTNYIANHGTYFKMFTKEQCQEIHSAVLEVLAAVGVEMHSAKALEIAKKGGAFVDGNRVRFPAAMVEKAIHSAPSRVVLANRDGERTINLENNSFYYGPGPTTTFIMDPITGERRFGTQADTKRAARVMEALPNIDFLMDFGTIYDVPENLIDIYTFEAMLTSAKKPIVHWAYNAENAKAMIDMAAAVCGGLQNLQASPTFALYTEPITPLIHEFDALDISIVMAEHGLPSIYTPAPQAGVTAPATMAGTIVIALAESLSGLVINQLVREGSPFIMGGVITLMDPKTTQITYGSPEFNILAAGLSEMAHYYEIPMFSTAGCVDSKAEDQQAAAEMATNLLMAALSGGNLIHDVGYFESGMSTSLLNLVMANEIIGMVKRIVRGIEVNTETLAVDVIKKVGPGGNFMAEEHTFQNFRKEWWFPGLFNRERFATWEAAGRPELKDTARAKLMQIIDEYTVEPLSDAVLAQISDVIKGLEV